MRFTSISEKHPAVSVTIETERKTYEYVVDLLEVLYVAFLLILFCFFKISTLFIKIQNLFGGDFFGKYRDVKSSLSNGDGAKHVRLL